MKPRNLLPFYIYYHVLGEIASIYEVGEANKLIKYMT